MRNHNIFGVPIFKSGNVNCPHFHDSAKKQKFDICMCPIAKFYLKENNHTQITSCSKDHNECVIFNKQNQSDVNFISNYIEKYSKGGWLQISNEHWETIVGNKISINTPEYLDALLKYFGYHIDLKESKPSGKNWIYNNNKIGE